MTAIATKPTVALTRLAKEINAAHHAAEAAGKERDEQVFLCGQKLLEAKKQAGHGNFIPWIEKNCEFDRTTAWRYMDFAKQHGNVAALKHLPPGQYAASVTPAVPPSPTELAALREVGEALDAKQRHRTGERGDLIFLADPTLPVPAQDALSRVKVLRELIRRELLPTLLNAHLSPEGARFIAHGLSELATELSQASQNLLSRNPPIGKQAS
jgi:hypothetical protein